MKTSVDGPAVDSAAVPVAEVAGPGSVGSPPLVPPGASAIGTEELVARYREALERIGTVCTNHVKPYTCRDEGSGKTIDARYTGDRWCEACIAADALRIPLRWRRGQTGYIRARVRQVDGVSPPSFIIVTVPSGESGNVPSGESGNMLWIDAGEVLTAAQVAAEVKP